MIRKPLVVVLIVFSLFLLIGPALAQEATAEVPGTVIVDGLNFPRGIAYDDAGNLYIAEAGDGGTAVIFEQEGTQITAGITSQVTRIAPDGTKSVIVPGLTSVFNPNEGGVALGVYRAIPTGDSLWLVLSDAQNLTVFSDAVVEIDMNTRRVKNYIDLYAYEVANNPDGREEIYSNPSDVAVGPDGMVYIVDTGANTLYTWAADAGLTVVKSWPNTVPTSIDFAPDGSIYVGFLGEGLVPGSAAIEHWSADGSELIETFSGLTTVSDVLVTEAGDVYATQLVFLGEEGPGPGSVVQVTADAITPIAENLPAPFGLALTPDGNLAVSTGSAFGPPGTGSVIEIALGG